MSKLTEIRIPDIGGATDVDVIELMVSAGDEIQRDTPLLTLETDKATMEVPSSASGTVKQVLLEVGNQVNEGDIILNLELSETEAASAHEPDEKPDASSQAADKPTVPEQVEAPKARMPESTAVPQMAQNKSEARHELKADQVLPGKVAYASPAVRSFARSLGVDLSQVSGSGRKGRIIKTDVEQFIKQALSEPSSQSGAALGLLPWPDVAFEKFGPVELKPLSRIKKISGANLHRNWVMIPHVTQHEQADITEMEAFRKSLKAEAEQKGIRLTPLVFLIKAVVSALQMYPKFNASLDEAGENLVMKQYFHIGVAVETPNGLMVPVLKDCDQKGFWQLAAELGELSLKAREGKLLPNEMQGGCFSISSLGGIGGTAFNPIINAPEVAILGVSRSNMAPVWDGEQFQPRLMLPLSLSYDHRVIDGADAARFVVALSRSLADIRRLLL